MALSVLLVSAVWPCIILSHMEGPEKLLAELIALPSVNLAFLPAADSWAGEWRVTDYLAAKAAKARLAVEFQEVFPASRGLPARVNLLVRLSPPKVRQRVILAPHFDTVGSADMPETHFRPETKSGRMHGRGACDTKGSVAAMFTALLRLAEGGHRPKETEVLFLGLVDEENAQEGSRAFAESKVKGDLAIVGEPTETRVVTAHKGDMWLRLFARGKAAHGARPELGQNAVHTMAKAVDLLEGKYAAGLRRRKHSLLGSPTINVGMIRGGTQPNIVPDHCEIQIDRRTIPFEKDANVRREILSFLREAGLKVELTNSKEKACMSLETNLDLPLVQKFMSLTGQRSAEGVDFFCDAAIIASGGTPAVVFGPGNIAQAHTQDEWISLKSLERATYILTKFLGGLP